MCVCVCVCVCVLVTFVSSAKTAELIEMLFGEMTQVGRWNHVLDPYPKGKGQLLGIVRPIENNWETLLQCTKNG